MFYFSFYIPSRIIPTCHRPTSCDFASGVPAICVLWNTVPRKSLPFTSGLPILWPLGYIGFWWSFCQYHSASYSYKFCQLLPIPPSSLRFGDNNDGTFALNDKWRQKTGQPGSHSLCPMELDLQHWNCTFPLHVMESKPLESPLYTRTITYLFSYARINLFPGW